MELCLGTVQFGMQYGVSSAGQPDMQDAVEMLEYAANNGISAIDTANAYGEAERIVGAFLAEHGREGVNVITKIRPGILYNADSESYYKILRQNLEESLATLGLKSVYGCLFHNSEYADDEAALKALARLKDDGLVQRVGISIYLPAEFRRAAKSPWVDIIQAPYNLMDTRLKKQMERTECEIHARSVFLQGLLLMDEKTVPQHLRDVIPYLQRLDYYCERNGFTRMQVLLNFVKLNENIHKVVFGVDNLEQLKQVIAAFNTEIDRQELIDLAEEFTAVDERLIRPNLWHVEYK